MRLNPFSLLRFLTSVILLSSLWFPSSGSAACFSPPGSAGDWIYNHDYHVPQYCDGTNWMQMGQKRGVGGSGCAADAAPTSGLVGWWKFDEGSGTTTADSSGNGYTGTLNGTALPTWTAGKLGDALTFAGIDESVSVPDTAALDLAGSWTISGWVNFSSLPGAGNVADIVEKTNASNQTNYSIGYENQFIDGNSTLMVYYTSSGGSTYVEDPSPISLNTWYLVTGVWDSSSQYLYLYINGSLVSAGYTGAAPQTGSGVPLYIGNTQYNNSGVNGIIDDVHVYNRALSASEVYALYAGTSPGAEGDMIYNADKHVLQFCDGTNWIPMAEGYPTSGLAGYWKFDEGSGTATADSSGNNLLGTLTNGPTWTTGGKINDALSFTAASNQFVDLGAPSALRVSGSYTVSAWVRPASLPTSGNVYMIFSSADSGGSDQWDLMATNNWGGGGCATAAAQFGLGFDSGGGYQCLASSGLTLNTGQWYHVAAVWDASASMQYVYVNGALAGRQSTGGNKPTGGAVSDIAIGASGCCGNIDNFNGVIDDVRYYKRALSDAEVAKLAMVAPAATECNPTSALAGWWKLDDGSGTSAADSSGNGDTGTLNNGPTWITGQLGDALTFSGSNQNVSVPAVSALNSSNVFTVTFWSKSSSSAAGNPIVIGGSGNIACEYNYTGGTQMACTPDGSTRLVANFTQSDGVWRFFAYVSNGTAQSLYMNGALVASATATPNTAGGNLCIGGGCTDTYFNGSVDDVRVYSRALSAADIYLLYSSNAPSAEGDIMYNANSNVPQYCDGANWNALGRLPLSESSSSGGNAGSLLGWWKLDDGLPPAAPSSGLTHWWKFDDNPTNGLVGWWQFDEGSGTSAADSSSTPDNGTLTGTPKPTWTTGKINGALLFDNANGYVNIPAAAKLQFSGPFSLSIWLKTTGLNSTHNTALVQNENYPTTGWALTDNGPNSAQIFFRIHPSNGGTACTTGSACFARSLVNDGNWHNIVGVYDGTYITVYVDGALKDTEATTGGFTNNTNGVTVAYPSGTQPTTIDDVRIYNRALSAAEIAQLYAYNGTAADSAGSATGTLNNSPTWGTGEINGDLTFNGTSQDVTASGSLGAGDVSVSAWVYPTGNGAGNFDNIFKEMTSGTTTRFLCTRDHALSDELVCADSQVSSPYANSSSAIPLNQWSLVTVTRTSGGVFNLYINGALNGSANESGGATSSDGASFIIGGDTASYYFAGSIDDVRTYGRVLGATEIAQIYEAGATTAPTSGLVGWWTLDDASSGTSQTSAADSSGNGNTGTTQSSPTWTSSGKIGDALTLNGTSQYVDAGSGASITNLSSFSWGIWVYPTSSPGGTEAILSKDLKVLGVDASGSHWEATVYTSGSNADTIGGTLNVNAWQYIAMTFDATTMTVYLYENGVLVSSATGSGAVSADSAYHLRLGSDQGGLGYFKGTIDDARFYNRVLSAGEIAQLYAYTGPYNPTTAVDSSGNNNTGTLTNGPTWTTGKINGALAVTNAANSYVDVSNPANFAFERTQPFSLTAWVYRTDATTEGVIIAKMTNATGQPGYSLFFPKNGNTACTGSCSTNNCLAMNLDSSLNGVATCVFVNNSAATLNAWHHVVVTYDGSSSAAGTLIYVDGALQNPSATSSSLSSSMLVSTDLKIGTDVPGTGDSFTGTIDDVRVYNRVLSPAEILNLYSDTSGD